MNSFRQQANIKAAKALTGWIYHKLSWLSPLEADQAHQERETLLEQIGDSLQFSSQGIKPHLGPLSPGCQFCTKETQIFHYINSACTRTCFFCPQDRSKNEETSPHTDGIPFESDEDFIYYLKKFGIQSIGFTGGEALLERDKLISRMKMVRHECGENLHFRLYTNGDLLNKVSLQELFQAGLNEIRFNISARDYELTPVRLAKGIIPVVSVEIPAIPEHIKQVKKAMLEMEAIGVDFLNLIQLEISQDNYLKLLPRNYHVCHRQFLLPVFESEICVLKLMLFRQEKNLNLPVSYCGFPYRFEVTNAQMFKRYNQFEQKGWQELTQTGVLRTFTVNDAHGRFAILLQQLEETPDSSNLWWCNEDRTQVQFHHSLLPVVGQVVSQVVLQYSQKKLLSCRQSGLVWRHDILAEYSLGPAAVRGWQQLYLEHKEPKQVFRSFVQHYPMETKDSLASMAAEMKLLKEVAGWELLDCTYPEVIF